MRTVFAGVLLAPVVWAQVQASSNTWSLQDSLKSAEAIITGELVEASAHDAGDAVHVQGTVRITNVIKGGLAMGAALPVKWQYQPLPNEGLEKTSKIPNISGLWLLKRAAADTYEPLRVSMAGAPHGGHVIPLPNTVPVLSGDTAEQKLAATLGEALIAIANAQGARLNPELSPGGGMRIPREAMPFHDAAEFLMQLEPNDSAAVLDMLAGAAEPNLRVLGYAGQIRTGNIATLQAVERQAAQLSPTLESRQIVYGVSSIPRLDDPALVEALGQLALTDQWPGLGSMAASRISFLPTPAGLPFSAVMLDSPALRQFGISGFCSLMRPSDTQPSLGEFWNEATQKHCGGGPPTDEHVAFWKAWWQANRTRVEQIHGKPLAQPRHSNWPVALEPQPEPLPVPLTTRFRSFLHSSMAFREIDKQQRGVESDRPRFGPPFSKEDAERFNAIATEVEAKLEQLRKRDVSYMNECRVQNKKPDPETLTRFWQENEDTVSRALERARTEMTPDGWERLERGLMEMRIVGSRAR